MSFADTLQEFLQGITENGGELKTDILPMLFCYDVALLIDYNKNEIYQALIMCHRTGVDS